MATASFLDIRHQFPEAQITLLVRNAQSKVINGSDFFDELLIDDSSFGLGHLVRLINNLRKKQFDLCLLFTNSLRTAFVMTVAGIPARIGFAKGGQSFFLTQAIEPILSKELKKKWQPMPMPMPKIYSRLCEAIGVKTTHSWPQLTVTKTCEDQATALKQSLAIATNERLIGLVPGASFGQSKLWPSTHFAATADHLSETYSLRTIILSGPGEEKITKELAAAMKTRPIVTDKPINLDVLKPIIRDLALLVATDTGPRHFATAFKVPTVVVMGPTDPRWSGVNLDYQEVVRHDVSCGPCHKKICPEDHRCMIGITPGEVIMKVEALDHRLGIFK